MSKRRTVDLVREELIPFLDKEGYCLYHMEFLKESRDWFLRVFIETKPSEGEEWPGNVSSDDCVKVSKFLSERLDLLDLIDRHYYLEVSSPGMDRPLIKKEDYIRYIGWLIDIKLYKSIEGRKSFTGKLLRYADEYISVEDEKGEVLDLPKDKISKINLTIVF